jgi:phosphatidylglycerophosphate synthase
MKTKGNFIKTATNTISNCVALYCISCSFLIIMDIGLAAHYGLEQSTYFSMPVNPWIMILFPASTYAIVKVWMSKNNIRIKRKPSRIYKAIPIFYLVLALFFGFLSLENKLSAYMHLQRSIIGKLHVDTPVQYAMLMLFIICIWSGIEFFKRGLVERPISYNRYDSLNF